MNFNDLEGYGWLLLIIVLGASIVSIVDTVIESQERTMKMALEAGCSQTIMPGRNEIVWTNCSKNLPPVK